MFCAVEALLSAVGDAKDALEAALRAQKAPEVAFVREEVAESGGMESGGMESGGMEHPEEEGSGVSEDALAQRVEAIRRRYRPKDRPK